MSDFMTCRGHYQRSELRKNVDFQALCMINERQVRLINMINKSD